MKTIRTALIATALLAGFATGCQGHSPEPGSAGQSESRAGLGDGLGDSIARGMGEARREMATKNITVSHDGAGKAEISPQGDLIIDGKTVQVNPQQRQLLLDYRAQTLAIASAGMDVGAQGADLAVHAVGEALRGVFSGNPDRIEERMKGHEAGIRQAAMKLCDRLPAMLASQQRLAAAVPEFAPYATMDASDVEDCRKDSAGTPTPPAPPAPPAAPAPPAPPAPKA